MVPEQLNENRRQLARLARQKSKRRVPRDLPCTWQPWTVINPEDNQPFTDAGAWEFTAQLLEDIEGQCVEVLKLTERPAGTTAYVIKHALPTGKLYIKVHYGHGPCILGRSFHYSERPTSS